MLTTSGSQQCGLEVVRNGSTKQRPWFKYTLEPTLVCSWLSERNESLLSFPNVWSSESWLNILAGYRKFFCIIFVYFKNIPYLCERITCITYKLVCQWDRNRMNANRLWWGSDALQGYHEFNNQIINKQNNVSIRILWNIELSFSSCSMDSNTVISKHENKQIEDSRL